MAVTQDRIAELMLNHRPELTFAVLGYEPQTYIGTQVFPIWTLPTWKGRIPKFNKQRTKVQGRRSLLALPDTVRTSWTYHDVETEEFSLGTEQDRNEIHASRTGAFGFDIEAQSAAVAKDAVLLDREYRIAQIATADSNFSGRLTTVTSGSGWNERVDDVSVVDPLELMDDACYSLSRSSVRPNRCAMGITAWRAIQFNTRVKKFFYGELGAQGVVTEEMIRQFLRLDRLVIGGAQYDDGTGTMVDIWGDDVILYHASDNPKGPTPCFGALVTMSFGQVGGREILGFSTSYKKDNGGYVQRYDYTEFSKPQIIMSDCGYKFKDVVQ